MPPIELRSVESFSAWLDDTVINAVPFGLSARLRPLLTPSGAAPARSVILVRPHAGHVLLSLRVRGNGEALLGTTVCDDGHSALHRGAPAASPVDLPGWQRKPLQQSTGTEADLHAFLLHPPTSACRASPISSDAQCFPFVLQTLLQLTRCDGGDASVLSSFPGAGLNSAAVDGVGRKLSVFAALLRHCAQWWVSSVDANHGAWLAMERQAHALYGRPSRPTLFFDSSAVMVPGAVEYGSSDCNAQRCFLRVLRRLSQRGGWCLHRRTPSRSAECHSERIDWLDYVVQRAIQCSLHPSGDYSSLVQCASSAGAVASASLSLREPDVWNDEVLSEPVVAVEKLWAVLWHVLATEVDEEVLVILHRLAREFVCGPSAANKKGKEGECTSGILQVSSVPLATVRFTLRRLARDPANAFACCSFPFAGPIAGGGGGAASAPGQQRTPVTGPLSLSRLLPPEILLLPFAAEHSSSSTLSPRFFLRGIQTPSAGCGAAGRRALRVLLLRVDAEGSWLPPAEELASRRTFHASYQQQAARDRRDGALQTSSTDDGSSEEEPDSLALQGMQGTAARVVTCPVAQSHASGCGPSSSVDGLMDCSPAEDRMISLLTAHVMHKAPFAQIMTSASARDELIWSATVRLYVYALIHNVRVILTPEKLPALTLRFGYRHLHQLHRTLCDLRQAWVSQGGVSTSAVSVHDSNDVIDATAVALLSAMCAREPPVAIYATDQLDLHSFAHLQKKVGDSALGDGGRRVKPSHMLLPVVLCRDVLRHPSPSPAAQVAAATTVVGEPSLDIETFTRLPHGVFVATYCCVLDEEIVCRTWAQCPSTRDADALMESCAGAESLFVADQRHLCLIAVEPSPPASMRVSERGTRATSERCSWKGCAATPSPSGQDWPSILLVAPTHVHAAHYGGLLRKAALALLDALPNEPPHNQAEKEGIPQISSPTQCSEDLRGVVCGGGAFYVALARHLRLLLHQLQQRPSLDGSVDIDVSARDHRWVCYLLYLLAEACGAVATQHAEPVIENGGASVAVSDTRTRGPRARRRLWLEVLREAVERRSTDAPQRCTELPALHVHHTEGVNVLAPPDAMPQQHLPADNSSPQSEKEEALPLYTVAMDLFAPQKPLTRQDAACEAKQSSELPLLEPLIANVRAIREAMWLLLLTLSSTV
jgi:hypothetical protein